jgi:hypothetical protein
MLPLSLSASCSSGVRLHKNANAEVYNFKPEFLEKWTMDEGLWARLPEDLHNPVKQLQHAGASVLSSLERLEERAKHLPEVDDEDETSAVSDIISNGGTASELVAAKLEEHVRLMNNKPNRPKNPDKTVYNCKPIPDDKRYLESFYSSQSPSAGFRSFGSFSGTNSTGFISPTALMSPPSLTSPISPFEDGMSPLTLSASGVPMVKRHSSDDALAKVDAVDNANFLRRDSILTGMTSSSGSHRSGGLRFKAPKHYKSGMYYMELEELRQHEMTRLRHSQHPITRTWNRLRSLRPLCWDKEIIGQFENWFAETQRNVASLDEHVKGLCAGIHFSLGWSDTPGLDFEYRDRICT